MKMAPSSGKRMACAPHCFSLPTGCTRLLWPRLKAHLPASSPPPSRFSRLYTIPCRYSPWHRAGLAARPSIKRGRGISEVTALSCGDSLSLLEALVWMVLMYCRLCSVLSLHMSSTGGRGYSHKGSGLFPLLNRQRETPSGVGCPGGAIHTIPACVFCVAAWTVAPSAGPQHHAGQTDAPSEA